MDITLETLGPTARALRVELPAERFAAEVDRRLRRLARTLRVRGFRPGRVPLQVVRQRHLPEVNAAAVEALVRESLPEALRREELAPVLEPRVEVESVGEDRPLRYRAGFDVFPALDPARVAGLELRESSAAVSDAEVAAALEQLRRRHADWEPAERPAAAGDRARLVYELGDPPPPLGEQSPTLELDLEEGAPGAELRAAVLGRVAGDEGEAALGADGPGRACRFRVEAVERPRLPAWDDAEFLRRCGAGDGGREELAAAARRHLEGRAVERRRAALRRQVVRGLAGDGADMLPVPETLQAWCLELRARRSGGAAGGGRAGGASAAGAGAGGRARGHRAERPAAGQRRGRHRGRPGAGAGPVRAAVPRPGAGAAGGAQRRAGARPPGARGRLGRAAALDRGPC